MSDEERDLRCYVKYVPTPETLEREWRAIAERLDARAPSRLPPARRTSSGLRMTAVKEDSEPPEPSEG